MRPLRSILFFAIACALIAGASVRLDAQWGQGPRGGLHAAGNNTAIDGTPQSANASSGTSLALPAFSTTNAGDRICVVCLSNGTYVSSVTSAHVTFALRLDNVWTGGTAVACSTHPTDNCLSFFDGVAAGALTNEIVTANLNGSTGFETCHIFAISGQNGFDANGSLPAVASALNSQVPISTTASNTMALGFYRFGGTANPTQGAGMTIILGNNYLLTEYSRPTSPLSSFSLPIGTGNTDENNGIGDAVKSQ